jgi:hypothetical protein
MADHCAACRSTDVLAGTDFRTCLTCGESTFYADDPVPEPKAATPTKKAPSKAAKAKG